MDYNERREWCYEYYVYVEGSAIIPEENRFINIDSALRFERRCRAIKLKTSLVVVYDDGMGETGMEYKDIDEDLAEKLRRIYG